MMTKKVEYINLRGKSFVFSPDNSILITTADGFTNTNVDITISRGVNQYGGVVTGQSLPEREITLEGRIIGESETIKQELLSVIEPMVEGNLIAFDRWMIKVYPQQTPAFSLAHDFADFQLSFIAPFPYWEDVNYSVIPLSGILPAFKFPWNLKEKWQFGKRVDSYFINVKNSGNVEIPYTLTIKANDTASNPSLLNVKTNEILNINIDLEQDEVLTITNTHNQINAYSTIKGEVSGLIDLESTLYRLHIGDNILRYDAESGREKLDVTIAIKPEVSGVVL